MLGAQLCHFSYINKCMEDQINKHSPLHRHLTKTQTNHNFKAVQQVLHWLEENSPFDPDRDSEKLVSFSTGFTSNGDDAVNAERATEIGRAIQKKLDKQTPTATIELKSRVQALSSLRKIPKVNEKKIHLDSIKFFNRLIVIAQREMTVETSLEYELTPFPLSLFSYKDHKMNQVNKVGFSKNSLKKLMDPQDLTN